MQCPAGALISLLICRICAPRAFVSHYKSQFCPLKDAKSRPLLPVAFLFKERSLLGVLFLSAEMFVCCHYFRRAAVRPCSPNLSQQPSSISVVPAWWAYPQCRSLSLIRMRSAELKAAVMDCSAALARSELSPEPSAQREREPIDRRALSGSSS